MEGRHTISEPRPITYSMLGINPQGGTGGDYGNDPEAFVGWEVDIFRENVEKPVDTFILTQKNLPPRKGGKKGNKIVWKLPEYGDIVPSFGTVEKGRILDIFRDRRKQRKKEAKKNGGGTSSGSTDGSAAGTTNSTSGGGGGGSASKGSKGVLDMKIVMAGGGGGGGTATTNERGGGGTTKGADGGGSGASDSKCYDGDGQSSVRTSSTESSSSYLLGNDDGQKHDGKTIHCVKSSDDNNNTNAAAAAASTTKKGKKREKAKKKKGSSAIDADNAHNDVVSATTTTTTNEKSEDDGGDNQGVEVNKSDKHGTREKGVGGEDLEGEGGKEEKGLMAAAEDDGAGTSISGVSSSFPSSNTAAINSSAGAANTSASAASTPDIKRRTVAPPPGFMSSGFPRSSVLKPMSPGKIGLPTKDNVISRLPSGTNPPPFGTLSATLGVSNEADADPKLSTNSKANPSQSTPASFPFDHNKKLAGTTIQEQQRHPHPSLPTSRSSSFSATPPRPRLDEEERRMSSSALPSNTSTNAGMHPASLLAPQYIHFVPSNVRSLEGQITPLPANPVELAKSFLDLYYAKLSSSTDSAAASLLPYYTPSSQKSISIKGAHSVVTGFQDIARQLQRSRTILGSGNMRVLSVVAQELYAHPSSSTTNHGELPSNNNKQSGGVLVVVTGMTRALIPTPDSTTTTAPAFPSLEPSPSLVEYSFPFSHTITLVPTGTVPVNVPVSSDSNVAPATAFSSPLQKHVVGYQIHNDALVLMSGDAYRS